VVYTAPWCRKTKQSDDFLNTLQADLRQNPAVGMMLIIGNDEPENVFAYGANFPGLRFYDPGDVAAEILAIDMIPDVLMINSSGQITYRDNDIPYKTDERTVREFLAEVQQVKS
jgi:hypothetical protein